MPLSWLQQVKLILIVDTGLAKDALHIYIGLFVVIGAALLFRWRLSSWKPWLTILAVAVGGEIWDIRDAIVTAAPVGFEANLHDVWNTMFWPTALMLLARFTPVFDREPPAPEES